MITTNLVIFNLKSKNSKIKNSFMMTIMVNKCFKIQKYIIYMIIIFIGDYLSFGDLLKTMKNNSFNPGNISS